MKNKQKIRIGNDIGLAWEFFPSDNSVLPLSADRCQVLIKHQLRGCAYGAVGLAVTGNVLTFRFMASDQHYTGDYALVATFILPDSTSPTGFRTHTVDVVSAFALVPVSALVTPEDEATGVQTETYSVRIDTGLSLSSNMAIALKGDPFRFEDFTPEQIKQLQAPSVTDFDCGTV